MSPPVAPETAILPVEDWLMVFASIAMLPPPGVCATLEAATWGEDATPAALIVPLLLASAAVISTCPAGLPPSPALALIMPLLLTTVLPSSTIRPALLDKPVASNVPELLTTPP